MRDAFSPGWAAGYGVRVVIDEIGCEKLLDELDASAAPEFIAVQADDLTVLSSDMSGALQAGVPPGMRNRTPVSSSETAHSLRARSSSCAAPEEPTGRG